VNTHAAVTASSAIALDHGFQTALYTLTGLLLVGALIAITLLRPAGPTVEAEAGPPPDSKVAFEEAA
jgi:hypothetical protein